MKEVVSVFRPLIRAWTLLAVGFVAVTAPNTARAKPQADAKAAEARMMNCAGRVAAALESKTLDTVRPDGRGVRVVAGPEFLKMKFSDRQKTIADVNCLAVGGNGGTLIFDVLHWQSGKRIGRFATGKFKMD